VQSRRNPGQQYLTLNIDEIGPPPRALHPSSGTHFFSPANVMRLLEIVRGKAVARKSWHLHATLEETGKMVCWSQLPRLSWHRMFQSYVREAVFWWRRRRIEAVDQPLYNFGMAMGHSPPTTLPDHVGWRFRKEYRHLEKPGIRRLSPLTIYARWAGSARRLAPAGTSTTRIEAVA